MSMIIHEDFIEIFVPNSEAVICAQHNGIQDRSVGSYYMSEQTNECIKFLNNFNGVYLIDLCASYFNVKQILDKLIDLGWEDCFKNCLKIQKSNMEVLEWTIKTEKNYLYKIQAPIINENQKYLKFDNLDIIFNLIKTLILGDIMKIVIKKYDNTFIMYVDDAGKIEDIKNNKTYMKWIR